MATTTKAVTISAGECVVLPNGAVILSQIVNGGATATASCGDLPTPSEYICYRFAWEDDDSGSMQDAYIESLIVGGNTYAIPSPYNQWAQASTIHTYIGNNPAIFGGLVAQGCEDSGGGMSDVVIKIKVPDGLAAPQLKVVNPGPEDYVSYLVGVVDEDCDTCP